MKAIAVFCSMLMSGFSAGASDQGQADPALLASLQQEADQWMNAFNTNAEALRAFYTEDAVIAPPASDFVRGADGIADFWKKLLTGKEKMTEFKVLEARADKEIAFAVLRFVVKINPPNGEQITIPGKAIKIFQRQADGNWRIQYHLWNHNKK